MRIGIIAALIIIILKSSCIAGVSTLPSDSIVCTPLKSLKKGFFFQLLFGKHYRKVWSAPVKVEVFNIKKESGGLKPIRDGGNFQTKSLTLSDSTGREYVLRSVTKDPSKALPKFLRHSPLGELMKEQNTAENPYGALIVPRLAESAGIYYTIPKLVYVPYDTCFGKYTNTFSNQLFLFESRPKGNQADMKNYGNSKKVVSTTSMLEKRFEDNDNKIDDRLYLRSRLFDMLICDWGRHEDQWRWASYKENEKEDLLKPIPRDRDHAFYKFDDGVIPGLASKFFLTKFQSLNSRYGSVRGLNLSAEFLDRRLLNGLDRLAWMQIADSLKSVLTHQKIEEAVRLWPVKVYQANGKETIRKLKTRRDKLSKAAEKYYKILAWQVEIPGTDKNEKFIVERLEKGLTKVEVFKISKDGTLSHQMYSRVFNKKETYKIILIGLGGRDAYELKGKVKKGIKIAIVGKYGDLITDESSVKGLSKKTHVYNCSPEILNNETSVVTKPVYWYDRNGFKNKVKE